MGEAHRPGASASWQASLRPFLVQYGTEQGSRAMAGGVMGQERHCSVLSCQRMGWWPRNTWQRPREVLVLQSTGDSKQEGSGRKCPKPSQIYPFPRSSASFLSVSGGVHSWRGHFGLGVVILAGTAAAEWKGPVCRKHHSRYFFRADCLHVLGRNVWIIADMSYGSVLRCKLLEGC